MLKRAGITFKRLTETIRKNFDLLDQASGNRLGILPRALSQFTANRSAEAASSLAYWWFFSLFPLLAGIVSIASYFVDPSKLLDTMMTLISPVLPFPPTMIALNLIRFIQMRGALGIIAILGFIWSASNVFIIIYSNINIAWDKARFRSFLQKRLIALGMVAIILLLLILFLFMTTTLDLLRNLKVPWLFLIIDENSLFMQAVTGLAPIVTSFLIFFVMYRFIPNTRVRPGDAFWAALACTAVWELTSNLFGLYINSGLVQFDLVFGSLATIAVLMLWFYLNSFILLLGAHISAAVANRRLIMSVQQAEQKEP